jgi:hypothetical protein
VGNGYFGRPIGRAIIDDDDFGFWQEGPESRQSPPQSFFLVFCRKHYCDLHPIPLPLNPQIAVKTGIGAMCQRPGLG